MVVVTINFKSYNNNFKSYNNKVKQFSSTCFLLNNLTKMVLKEYYPYVRKELTAKNLLQYNKR